MLPSCGKKRRGFFEYTKQQQSIKINRLSFPAVHGIEIRKLEGKNHISWLPTKNAIGYNVYTLKPGKFIQQKPLNKKLIITNTFFDTRKNQHEYNYLIRGVFKSGDNLVDGPFSKILEK